MIGGGPEHLWQLVRHLPIEMQCFIAAPSCEPYGERFLQCVGQSNFLSIPQRKFTLTAFGKLLHFIKKHNIQIIHSHGKGAGIYGRLAALFTGTKSIHTFHGIHLPSNRFVRMLYSVLEQVLCRISKVCIAVSDGEAKEAKKLKFGKNIITIYNGVQIPEHMVQKDMQRPFKILHVSRFDTKQKNSLFLYDIALAMQKKDILTQCQFILVGDGEELPILKDKLRNAQLLKYFTFAGIQKDVTPFYKEASCLISTSRWEGLPLAVLEAGTYGVPTIASNVVGNRDAVVHGKTGFLYELGDVDGAVGCVEKLLDNIYRWKEMRIKTYIHIGDSFSVQRMAKTAIQEYNKITPSS